MRKLIIALAIVAAASAAAAADTNVSGNVSGIWNINASPYVLTGNVTVPVGAVLSINPGVIVKFGGHYKFIVNGKLDAQGTQFAPITFTRNTLTDTGWGIRFIDATAAQSVIRGCTIEFNTADDGVSGGGEDDYGGGIFIKNSNVLIEQNTIRNNTAGFGGGIAVYGALTAPAQATIRRNRITGNGLTGVNSIYAGGGGVFLEGTSAAATVSSNLIYGNGGPTFGDNFEGGGGMTIDGGNPSVTNNTFFANAAAKGPGIHVLPFTGSAPVVANNIVWGNTGSVNGGQISLEVDYLPSGALSPAMVMSHNVVGGGIQKVYRNMLESTFAGTATLTTDPLLFNPAAGVFELRATSPAIDSANSGVAGYVSSDYYALARVDVAAVANTGAGNPINYADRGAIEWIDGDADTIADGADNCIGIANTTQLDTDGDTIGDACDSDDDNDGSLDANDCGPLDNSIHPGAAESCDLVDSNCNGSLVDTFTNTDGDAQPDCVDTDDDGDGSLDAADCAPLNSAIHPGATEACDLVDSNCNGSLVDTFTNTDGDAQPDCVDTDDDGDGTLDTGDCGPTDATIHPGATEACDLVDSNCNGSLVDTFTNTDGDTQPDCVDTDDDGDGSTDAADCAPLDATVHPGATEACDLIDSNCNGSLVDSFPNTDGDAQPNCVDTDDDNDGSLDAADCAPLDDTIHPGATEACDAIDSDCDTSLVDEFPNADGDPQPDCTDTDDDGDGVLDTADNCPLVPNPDQMDTDHNNEGDACADDRDGDTVLDADDDCPDVADPGQLDTDTDGMGDACDSDDDGDGVGDGTDVCPLVSDAAQIDTDHDGMGDACDADDDGDGVDDTGDVCPLVADPGQADGDHDGMGDACEGDQDGDGVRDDLDNCPTAANATQEDGDTDGLGDACDPSNPEASTLYSCGAGRGGAGAVPLALALGLLLVRRRRRA